VPTEVIVVDAFTDRAYAGNPAAVCILPGPANEEWMRNVAREMNLAETAFLHPERDGYRLRWLTPETEVDLCGHATLASAHVLWQDGHLAAGSTAHFHTRSGHLSADQRGGLIELDFPEKRPEACPAPTGLLEALGAEAVWVGRNEFDYFVELADEAALRALQPDYTAIARLSVRGVIVTSAARPGSSVDFVSRFFAPAVGVNEDPVTGSAHCALGPHWGRRLGKDSLTGFQASRRGGTVHVRLAGDRVILSGTAVTTLRGTLLA
jgi:PhzF family phenazine biosynthesis protein